MNEISETRDRLTNIDLIKFVASILIVCHHFQQLTGIVFDKINFYGGEFFWGYITELFFMISGFLTIRSDKTEKCFLPFIRKYVRLLPSVWAADILLIVVVGIFYARTGNYPFGQNLDILNITTSMLLIRYGWFPTYFGINSPTWYLSVLLQCYMLFYAVKKLTLIFKNTQFKPQYLYILIIAIELFVWTKFPQVYIPFFNGNTYRGTITFFIGCLLAMLINSSLKKHFWKLWCGIAVLLAAIIFYKKMLDTYSLVFLLYPLIVGMAAELPQIGRGSRLPEVFGGISLEIYVWHMPIMYIYLIALFYISTPINSNLKLLLCFLAVIIIWSAVVYFVYERNIQKFMVRVGEKIKRSNYE